MTHIELAGPQGQLLDEIANPKATRDGVALTYALALRTPSQVDWPTVNRAIVARWSYSALDYIKRRAWQRHVGGGTS